MASLLRMFVALMFLPLSAVAQPIPSGSPASSALLNGSNVAGRSYYPAIAAIATNTALGAANRLYATPVRVAPGSVLKSLSFNIGTGNAVAWNARMCVYADNGNGMPGSLVPNADTGTVAIGSGSVTGVQTATLNGSNGVPVSDWIWVAFMADSTAESLFSINGAVTSVGALMTNLLGAASPASVFASTGTSGVYMAQTFGACPGSFGAITYNNGAATPFLVLGF